MLMTSRHTDEDRGLDAYFTPREAIIALLALERTAIPPLVWEPACGDGAIAEPIRSTGRTVIASDIADYTGGRYGLGDYLQTRRPPISGPIGVITNPPFKLAVPFLEKALKEAQFVAFLLRTNFLESEERLPFFRKSPPSRLWVSSRRLPQMHRHGWTGPRASSNICYSWFVWGAERDRSARIGWFDYKDYTEADAGIVGREHEW